MDSLFVVVWLLSASFGNYGTVESKFEKKFKDRPSAELFVKKAPKQCKNFEITSELFDGETKPWHHNSDTMILYNPINKYYMDDSILLTY